MLTEKQYSEIRKELDECTRPLFFYHDDADGVCSFLLLYRYIREGKGVCVKSTPRVDMKFYRQVEEYQPDKIFVVDLAMMDQEFIDKCKVPIIWIDHHTPQDNTNVKYFNPRINGNDNLPASYLCYRAVKQDIWISMLGCIGDWHYPDFADEFKEKYPGYVDDSIKDPETALFESKIGRLVKIVSFLLKGATSDVNKSVKIMTRVKGPDDFFNKELAATKFMYKKIEKIDKDYEVLLKAAVEKKSDDKILLFKYSADATSITKELSNEVQHNAPNKLVIIYREKGGEMKCSVRSQIHLLPPIIEKATLGIGYGGGHEHACGAVVKAEHFEEFLDRIREEI